jgi:hypothetical protein
LILKAWQARSLSVLWLDRFLFNVETIHLRIAVEGKGQKPKDKSKIFASARASTVLVA